MVIPNHYFCLLALQADAQEKIPPPERAAIIMALIGILLLGMLLVVIILLGGHWVRRLGSYRRGPAVPADFHVGATEEPNRNPDQTHQPSPDDPNSDDSSNNDTVRIDDTIVS